LTRSRSVGSRSCGAGHARVKRGGGFRSGASDLDPAAQIACKRWPPAGGEGRRRPVMSSGGVRRRTLTRALVLGLGRGAHLRVARESAKRQGAAAAAETRQRGRATRRHGSGTLARPLGCYGAPTRQQTTAVCSSPPGAALGQLHVNETAAEARNRRRRRKLGFRLWRRTKLGRLGHGWGSIPGRCDLK
jgi:hypothetical protein